MEAPNENRDVTHHVTGFCVARKLLPGLSSSAGDAQRPLTFEQMNDDTELLELLVQEYSAMLFFVLALFAMASAQRGRFWGSNRPTPVHFVNNDPNNPSGVHFVNNNNNPSGVNFVNNNPNDPTAVHIVDGNSDQVVITNPDPYFGQPSYPHISPAWVQRPYPGKQYDNPHARGGK
ncbi:hypothetical protein HW555_000038 [Spodoptera exigua]|uniref:Uncharacterized protein n=1 Tax=Spodoptera exigua TaxID=7107 RepID=A0A835GVB9_SPOEX|nr:hypothetical protein HW555_000038 [Spodoptera exigua]